MEEQFKKRLDARKRLGNEIAIAKTKSNIYLAYYETLLSIERHANEGNIISKRGNESYIRGSVLTSIIENAVIDKLGRSELDFYGSAVYHLVVKTLDLYEVFQTGNN